MNLGVFVGKDVQVEEVISMAETMPFFAERRLVIVEDSGLFKKDAGRLPDYLVQLPETTHMVFVESEVDKRSRMYKKVKELGYPAELKPQTERELKRWVLQLLTQEEIRLTEPVMDYFLMTTGTNMSLIRSELDKLISYLGDRKVLTREDIDAVCTPQVVGRIFDMTAALAAKDQKRALELYFDLRTLREPPMRILFLISRQYQQLLQAKELQQAGVPKEEIGKQLGIPAFVTGRLLSQAARHSMDDLKQAANACMDAEFGVKTGKIADVMAVELLIVRLGELG